MRYSYRAEDSHMLRAIYAQEDDHRRALIRAEEDGYNKGVRDMREEAERAIRFAPSLDENGYISEKAAILSKLSPHALQPAVCECGYQKPECTVPYCPK